MDQYKVFLYKVSATNISGDIATALWALFVQLPFNLFSFILQLLVNVLKVLNVGDLLSSLQSNMIDTSKSVFVALIGGKSGTVIGTSFVGLAVVLMAGYLLVQFTNGKGRFISSLVHFACVFGLVFFYFGTFSGSGVSQETGGEFLFQTVQKVTTTTQNEISKSLNPVIGSNDPTKIFTRTLKETANYINTGNVSGQVTGGTFDYSKASGDGGEDYVNGLADKDAFLKANNDELIQKITFGLVQSLDAYVMVLPMAVIDVLISVLNLILLILILLFPLSAALSFFPFFRNAAMDGLKKMLLFTALPAGLSILLAIVLYLLGQIDAPVSQAVSLAKVPNSFSFLVTLIVELALKLTLLWGLWRYRESLLSFLTGGSVSERGLGSEILRELKHGATTTTQVGTQAVEKTAGTVMLATGTAMMAGGSLVEGGSQLLGQEEFAKGIQNHVVLNGKDLAGLGLDQLFPEGFKDKMETLRDHWETGKPDPEEQPEEDSPRKMVEPDTLSLENETTSKIDENEQFPQTEDFRVPEDRNSEDEEFEENPDSAMNQEVVNPFVQPFDSENNEKTSLNSSVVPLESGNGLSPKETPHDEQRQNMSEPADSEKMGEEPATFESLEEWRTPIFEEIDVGEWDGAIQDLASERGEDET
ncbi:hypothetical protein [Lactococcus lactis]|uniref:Uncharacterized protein n=1 Tax=Lactococcus lactis subsp. lactis A12 TaxID=1137134 RepID=S6EWI8_LACLL|nr:hypothetical protein [Lactococcus lactis]CDG03733.1 putative uncharacterized protein [Lactococcus lactis subsp. lactis A12]SBW29614.1 putative uncharacterized protein [Lactococcus lactis subsp. lactis]